MRTTRWLAAMVVSAWWLAGGPAWSADDKPHPPQTKAHAPVDGKVNINEADHAELMKLEGVGAGTAKKIVAWREAHGPFKRARISRRCRAWARPCSTRTTGASR